jgi:hypothetical protein
MITIAGGFALMIVVFIVVAAIFAVASASTFSRRMESIHARLASIALGVAVASALAAIWLAVVGL